MSKKTWGPCLPPFSDVGPEMALASRRNAHVSFYNVKWAGLSISTFCQMANLPFWGVGAAGGEKGAMLRGNIVMLSKLLVLSAHVVWAPLGPCWAELAPKWPNAFADCKCVGVSARGFRAHVGPMFGPEFGELGPHLVKHGAFAREP